MSGDTSERRDDEQSDDETDTKQLLSDLSVNVVPIGIIAVFVLGFALVSPAGDGGPLLAFHGALIGGIVVVSAVAGWAISRENGALEGSAANDDVDRD